MAWEIKVMNDEKVKNGKAKGRGTIKKIKGERGRKGLNLGNTTE